MQIVPIEPLPNQALQVQLAEQPCALNIYQLRDGVFIDVYVGGALIIGGVIGRNLTRIVRSAYLGFVGDFVFADTQGDTDPIFNGLGSRFLLIYLEEADLAE